LSEIGVVEQSPVQDGRNMTMLLAPSKAVLATEKDAHPEKASDGRRPRGSKEEPAVLDSSADEATDAVETDPEPDEASSGGQAEAETEPSNDAEAEAE